MKRAAFLLFLGCFLWHNAWSAVEYAADGSKDPFFDAAVDAAPASAAAAPAVPVLNGILWSPSGSLAEIDGHRVKAGDHLGDIEIVNIEHKRVELRRGGKTGYLTIKGLEWADNG